VVADVRVCASISPHEITIVSMADPLMLGSFASIISTISCPFRWNAKINVMISFVNCLRKFVGGRPCAAYIHSCWERAVRDVIDASGAPSHTLYAEMKVILMVPWPVSVSHDHLPRLSLPLSRKRDAH